MSIVNATYMYNAVSGQPLTQHFVVVATCVKVLNVTYSTKIIDQVMSHTKSICNITHPSYVLVFSVVLCPFLNNQGA